MRGLIAIAIAVSLAAGYCGCGSDQTQVASKEQRVRFGTFTGKPGGEPHFDVPNRTAPQKSYVRDIKVGKGPGVRNGDTILVYYVRAYYKTGKPEYTRWPPEKPLEWKLFGGAAWEREIEGMKAGGRREMLIPSRLAFGEGAFDYMFDLVAIKHPH